MHALPDYSSNFCWFCSATSPRSTVSNPPTSHSAASCSPRSGDRAYSEYHPKTKYVQTGHFLQRAAYLSSSAQCRVAISLPFSRRMTVPRVYFERLNKDVKFNPGKSARWALLLCERRKCLWQEKRLKLQTKSIFKLPSLRIMLSRNYI